jgi:HNH endonuclease/NUMOD4 motif
MQEAWKPIPDNPQYEVSNLGRIRSIDRTGVSPTGWTTYHKGRILMSHPSTNGYLIFSLGKTSKLVHRAVLEAFVGPCPEGMQTCHYNDVKTDNRLENLRWDTPKGNMADALRNDRWVGRRKLTKSRVRQIRRRLSQGEPKASIGRAYGVTDSTIHSIAIGKTWGWLK